MEVRITIGDLCEVIIRDLPIMSVVLMVTRDVHDLLIGEPLAEVLKSLGAGVSGTEVPCDDEYVEVVRVDCVDEAFPAIPMEFGMDIADELDSHEAKVL